MLQIGYDSSLLGMCNPDPVQVEQRICRLILQLDCTGNPVPAEAEPGQGLQCGGGQQKVPKEYISLEKVKEPPPPPSSVIDSRAPVGSIGNYDPGL